jgi:hypothetical protein
MPTVIDLNDAAGAALSPLVTLPISIAGPHRNSFPGPQSTPSQRINIDRTHHVCPNRRPPTLAQHTQTSIADKPRPLSP